MGSTQSTWGVSLTSSSTSWLSTSSDMSPLVSCLLLVLASVVHSGVVDPQDQLSGNGDLWKRSASLNPHPSTWLLDGGNDGQRHPVMEADYPHIPPGFEWSANFDNSDDRWLAHSQKKITIFQTRTEGSEPKPLILFN